MGLAAIAPSIGATEAESSSASVMYPGNITDVVRIDGADRFEVAVGVSKREPSGGNPVLYVVSGTKFPDALSAGPSAIAWQGQLLLVARDYIPLSVANEIVRLAPREVTLVGGVESISLDVEAQIRGLAATAHVSRVDGVDRYEVSRKLMFDYPVARKMRPYVATGASFADALSAGPIAGASLNPVLLVDGLTPYADDATVRALRDTGPITVVGGPASISESYFHSVTTVAPAVRIGGADRYEASVNINRSSPDAPTSADTAYLATGLNFPDALTGGVLAGRTDSPLYVVPGTCVPQKVLVDLIRLQVKHVVLLGGVNSLSPQVETLSTCA